MKNKSNGGLGFRFPVVLCLLVLGCTQKAEISNLSDAASLSPDSTVTTTTTTTTTTSSSTTTTSTSTTLPVCSINLTSTWTSASGGSAPYAQALKKVGNYVYLGIADEDADKGLSIIDVSNPAAPVRSGFFPTQSGAAVISGWGDDTLGVDVSGSYAYLATYMGGLVIVNVSNPAAPSYVGKLDLPNESWDVKVSGNTAFMANYGGIRAVNITDKTAPALLSTLNVGNSPRKIDIVGTKLYAATATTMDIIDISNPAAMTLLGSYTLGGGAQGFGVVVSGNYAFVAKLGSNSVIVLDVANAAAPVLVKTIGGIGVGSASSPRGVSLDGNSLLVSAGSAGANGGIYIYNVADPLNPVLKGTLDSPGSAWSAAKDSNDYIYISDGGTELQVMRGSGCF